LGGNLLTRVRDGLTFPVMMKEMRSRMRGTRAPWMILISTVVTISVAMLMLGMHWNDAVNGSSMSIIAHTMAELGRMLFGVLVLVEGMLAALLAPALTAGAISSEREQQTLEFLQLTRLSGTNIALGKLFSALSFLFLLLLCALPVGAVVFLLGGVSPGQFCWALVLLIFLIVGFGSIGLCCSVKCRTTTISTVISYLICLCWLGLAPLVVWLLSMYAQSRTAELNVLAALGLVILLLLLLSLIPTVICNGIYALFTQRHIARLGLEIVWGFFAICACLLLYLPQALGNLHLEYSLIANPIVAMLWLTEPPVVIVAPTFAFAMASPTAMLARPWNPPPPQFSFFDMFGLQNRPIFSDLPITCNLIPKDMLGLTGSELFAVLSAIGLLALAAWLALFVTVRALKRQDG